MRPAHLVMLGVLLGIAAPVTAQTIDSSHVEPPTHCVIPDSERTRVVVYIWADLPDSASRTFRAPAENLMQDVVNRLPGLLRGSPDSLPRGEPTLDWTDLGHALHITAFRNGRIAWRPGGVSDHGAAVLLGRALATAVADSEYFPWDSSMTGDSVQFRFAFVWPRVDLAGKAHPLRIGHAAVPAFSIAYPRSGDVRPDSGNQQPHYPDHARGTGYVGSVIMQFVVDTTGRAEMTTAHDIWPKDRPQIAPALRPIYEEFVQSVLHDLPNLRFHPATLGSSCPLRQLVQMPFVFTLTQ